MTKGRVQSAGMTTENTHCANCGRPVRADRPHRVGECRPPETCTVGSGFEDACQRPAKYAARWTDNGDEGLLCEDHAATARALPNGPSLTLRTLP